MYLVIFVRGSEGSSNQAYQVVTTAEFHEL